MSQYTEQAEKLLKEFGVEFRAVLVGSNCPKFCQDAEKDRDMDKVHTFPRETHIHGKHYCCTLSGQGRGHMSFDFWNSYNDEEKNYLISNPFSFSIPCALYEKHGLKAGSVFLRVRKSAPSAYDLLTVIQKSDVGSFENFCSEFGYDTDSRKAESIYHGVVKEWTKVQRFFTKTELEQLQEIQ